ncbi:uncharacterized protein LOC115408252 [Salarias fasciatus]|uniref:uncharacterized protein LOC115408252 n=1 Tax=Salarias fasciatus TaxID=181472 RepID=UPI001176BDF0|nr:uncharacterized protein LOC115408252 [Salarias fasciatus]
MDPANVDVSEESEEPVAVEEDSSTIRPGLHSCLLSCLSAVTLFFFGSMLGFPGGVLLGRTGVATLRSLELLADDKLLMDHLENYMNTVTDYDHYISEKMNIAHRSDNVHMFNVFISVLAEEFGGLAAIFSLPVGLAVGSTMYKLVIKKSGETATGKALSVAGPLCLVVISTSGCLLGLLLRMYLSITLPVIICFFFFVVFLGILIAFFGNCGRCSLLFGVLTIFAFSPLNTPIVLSMMYLMTFVFQTKLILSELVPKTSPLRTFAKSYGFDLIITPILLFLIITDVFNFARHPIVILQQTNTSSTGSAAVEGVFVGVLSSHFLMVAVGMSLFSFKEVTGAAKVCAGAVTSGGAAIAGIESVVSLLGPGPTIGALMGVAGAVGVTLTAAGATAFRYGQVMGGHRLMGLLGVTAGAAAGAYLASSTHGGLSALYMALCAAAVPGTLILNWMTVVLKRHARWSVINICFYLFMGVLSAVWVYFAIPIQGVLTFIAYSIVSTAAIVVLACVSCAFDFWGLTASSDEEEDESDPSSPEAQSNNRLRQLSDLFSLSSLTQSKLDILENLYNDAGGKLVHLSKSLRLRARPSQNN